jgi:plasmid stabilization system protein ParE
MKLRLSRRATQDLINIAEYLQSHSPDGAIRVRAAIVDGMKLLTQFPYAGRPQDVEGVRKLVMRRYPYLIYYVVDEAAGEVAIVTIKHSSREREFGDA